MGLSPNVARARSTQVSILPQFLHEDSPLLVEFFKAYYEWESTRGADAALESIKLNNDVDTVIDGMLGGYRRAFAKDFPINAASDFRHFSKFLKEFYQKKGTPDAFDMFFQAVYGEKVSIEYPRKLLFKPSGATSDNAGHIITSTPVTGAAFDQVGCVVVGKSSGASATVREVVLIRHAGDPFYILTVDDPIGEFIVGEAIECDSSEGIVRSTLVPSYSMSVVESDQVWYDGDVLDFPVNAVQGVVKKVRRGKVVEFTVTSGGLGYAVGDRVLVRPKGNGVIAVGRVSAVDGGGSIQGVAVTAAGGGYNSDWAGVTIETDNGTGASVSPVFDGGFMRIQVADVIGTIPYLHSSPTVTESIGGCVVEFYPSPIRYIRSTIVASAAPSTPHSKTHDSVRYQEFSYDVRSNANFDQHASAIQSLLHVAGMRMFARSEVVSETIAAHVPELIFPT